MKYCSVLVAFAIAAWLVVHAGAQSPASPEPRPASTMRQLMQGVIFSNANVVFAAQVDDPASVQRDARPSMSTNPLAGLYGGWQAIENSGLALAEAADLMNARGRLCSNDRRVPTQDAEWKSGVTALREAGLKAAEAARARNQDRMIEVAEQLTASCSGCHRMYRTRDNACVASRQGRSE